MATDATLTITQKNEALRVIQDAGLAPAEFEWREGITTEGARLRAGQFRVSVLVHVRTGVCSHYRIRPLRRHDFNELQAWHR